MAREEIDCHGRAAVAIEPVSADSLHKTGIFADLAGDFRRFLLQLRPNWESGEDDARKAGFFGPFSGVFGSLSERCTAWPGREDLNLQIAESKCPIVSRPLCLDDRPFRAKSCP